ncbi:hypothetical protein GOP47_0019322 [Adiantum capillus-veneris]|uniref:Uncharacterized protein n=1 Tax=Adiantum capillus-veneris TaxID=13818 RepID=A0A9D4Z8Z4_ADICA|nr:hypothetical protein GOP47_0019322 [Adiantum capillus-veneris]
MHEQVARLEKERIEEAMNRAMQFVYDDKNLFDGYDVIGYLTHYVQEMEVQNVPEGRMIEVFVHLVVPDFSSRVQEIQKHHGESWKDFEEALRYEYISHYLEEEFEFQSKDLVCTDLLVISEASMSKSREYDHTASILQDVPSRASQKSFLVTIDAEVGECLMQNNEQVQSVDKGILEVVYEEPKEKKDIYDYRSGKVCEEYQKKMESMPKTQELSQDVLQVQVQEDMYDNFYAAECVDEVEVGMQSIVFLGNDESKLGDARLLHMPFDVGGINVGYKVMKTLLMPFDPGGIHCKDKIPEGYNGH